ncbi:hypothetical protein BHE74_00037247 [Ensete ventricosum]|nr:hypothetical protein BHE74_00037247 [Ensete ventricosum]
MVKMVVAPVVASVFGSSPHRLGGLKESSLSDLEEDLSPSRVERSAARKEGGRPRQGPLQRWLATARPPAGAASHGLVIRKGAAGCGQGQSAREADGARKGRQMPAAYRRPTAGVAARRGDACGQKHRPQGLPPTISRGSVIGLQ